MALGRILTTFTPYWFRIMDSEGRLSVNSPSLGMDASPVHFAHIASICQEPRLPFWEFSTFVNDSALAVAFLQKCRFPHPTLKPLPRSQSYGPTNSLLWNAMFYIRDYFSTGGSPNSLLINDLKKLGICLIFSLFCLNLTVNGQGLSFS